MYGASRPKILYAFQSYDHELFQIDDYDVNMLATICRCNNKDINSGAQDDDNERLASRNRKPTLDLNRILNEGDEVVLTNGSGEAIVDEKGSPITAKYVGNNKFNCRDEVKRSSPLALYYLNEYGGKNLSSVNGNDYWRFNGQKLSSLRENYQEDEENDQTFNSGSGKIRAIIHPLLRQICCFCAIHLPLLRPPHRFFTTK